MDGMNDGQPDFAVGIAWYRPEQWDELLRLSEDADELEDTHQQWLALA